jgi:predicted esterase YcpF (UPF0227 family)
VPTVIHFQGGSVEVAETYNLVRQRVNRAERNKLLAEAGDPVLDTKGKVKDYDPAHEMSFTLIDDDEDETGRFSLNIDKYICVTSDELQD